VIHQQRDRHALKGRYPAADGRSGLRRRAGPCLDDLDGGPVDDVVHEEFPRAVYAGQVGDASLKSVRYADIGQWPGQRVAGRG